MFARLAGGAQFAHRGRDRVDSRLAGGDCEVDFRDGRRNLRDRGLQFAQSLLLPSIAKRDAGRAVLGVRLTERRRLATPVVIVSLRSAAGGGE
jgi:hypothetical protein